MAVTSSPVTQGVRLKARRTGPTLWMASPMALLMVAGYVFPGGLMFAISLGYPIGGGAAHVHLNFDKYIALAHQSYLWHVLFFTLLVSAATALLNAVLAYPVGLFLARSRTRWAALCYLITFTPLAVGMNMLTIGWLIMLGRNGVINTVLERLGLISDPLPLSYGLLAVIIGLAHISFTFMVLPLETVIRSIDPALERAARSLGAPRWKILLSITLALSWDGIAAGMLIVFMQSCGAFVIPLLLGGSSTVMLPVAIWEQMTVSNDRAGGAALSVVLTVIALVVLLVQLRFFNKLRGPSQ